MADKDALRMKVWEKLRMVASPDSRFHYDFSMFIPDFKGSAEAVNKLRGMDIWSRAKNVFITPDNCLAELRKAAVMEGKTTIMPTYGIKRGFLLLSRSKIPEGQETFASTLDGAEVYGIPISLSEIKKLKRIDLVVTGASAVNLEGVRYGKGHGYFDIEWGMLSELEVVNDETPIVTIVHDCQVVDTPLPIDIHDTLTDYIITPTRTIKVKRKLKKPKSIHWEKISEELMEEIPPLKELKKLKGLDDLKSS